MQILRLFYHHILQQHVRAEKPCRKNADFAHPTEWGWGWRMKIPDKTIINRAEKNAKFEHPNAYLYIFFRLKKKPT